MTLTTGAIPLHHRGPSLGRKPQGRGDHPQRQRPKEKATTPKPPWRWFAGSKLRTLSFEVPFRGAEADHTSSDVVPGPGDMWLFQAAWASTSTVHFRH